MADWLTLRFFLNREPTGLEDEGLRGMVASNAESTEAWGAETEDRVLDMRRRLRPEAQQEEVPAFLSAAERSLMVIADRAEVRRARQRLATRRSEIFTAAFRGPDDMDPADARALRAETRSVFRALDETERELALRRAERGGDLLTLASLSEVAPTFPIIEDRDRLNAAIQRAARVAFPAVQAEIEQLETALHAVHFNVTRGGEILEKHGHRAEAVREFLAGWELDREAGEPEPEPEAA